MVVAAKLDRYRAGVPVYRYALDPAVPPVTVAHLAHEAGHGNTAYPHIHDFPVLLYIEKDGGTIRSGSQTWQVLAGDIYVVAAGEVIGIDSAAALVTGAGRGVFFAPEALGGEQQLTAWRSHPLLFPFAHNAASGLLRLRVPAADRPRWSQAIDAIEAELSHRRDGYRDAVLAHLTLLLINVARLATDVVGDLRRSNEKLLAEVFATIEQRYMTSLSLSDVARAVNLTPGHVTTAVRRRTGRTVQEWITERRMTEARQLLTTTTMPVADVSRAVGFEDPSYFTRTFRRAHGITPRSWRNA